MAKFCTKCGKELNGKACDCSKNASTSIIGDIDVKESCMDCLNVLKDIFTKPIETIKDFVVENKFISGIIMIVVAAISAGLCKIATLKSMYSSTSGNGFTGKDLAELFSNAISGNLKTAKPDYLKEFFTTFADNLVQYALIVLIGYAIITILLKGKATWKQMITAVAISLSVVLVGYLVNSILVFVDAEVIGYIRGYVTSFAYIFSILILYKGVEEVSKLDKNKVFLSVASMSVFATAAIDIINKIFK